VFEVHDGKGWAEVGASYRLLSTQGGALRLGVYRGSAALYPGIPYPTPEARSHRVDIRSRSSLRPPPISCRLPVPPRPRPPPAPPPTAPRAFDSARFRGPATESGRVRLVQPLRPTARLAPAAPASRRRPPDDGALVTREAPRHSGAMGARDRAGPIDLRYARPTPQFAARAVMPRVSDWHLECGRATTIGRAGVPMAP
jgi:hypothetical protein